MERRKSPHGDISRNLEDFVCAANKWGLSEEEARKIIKKYDEEHPNQNADSGSLIDRAGPRYDFIRYTLNMVKVMGGLASAYHLGQYVENGDLASLTKSMLCAILMVGGVVAKSYFPKRE